MNDTVRLADVCKQYFEKGGRGAAVCLTGKPFKFLYENDPQLNYAIKRLVKTYNPETEFVVISDEKGVKNAENLKIGIYGVESEAANHPIPVIYLEDASLN